jgi:hypothetical protein
MIDVFRLVDEAKVAKVLEIADEMDTMSLGPLKERFGDEVSYTELRFILAYRFVRTEKGKTIRQEDFKTLREKSL